MTGVLADLSNNRRSDLEELAPLDQVLSDHEDDEPSMTIEEAVAFETQESSTQISAKKSKDKSKRRRRRSSARFLRLSGRFEADSENVDPQQAAGISQEQLGEIYQKAIRLNAENKINGQNTWGLKLIDNLDKIIKDDTTNFNSGSNGVDDKRINFTKASCTIDASVKIYSHRVDDVHLSSYKVLANLNRTGPSEKDTGDRGDFSDNEDDDDGARRVSGKKKTKSKARGEATLASNVASLNLSKLELSYSVDPLFHKMSKKFDEGGAKGLLLVNLGVSSDSCTILFDSKEEKEKSLIADDANARSREIPTDANESDDVNTSKIVSSPSTVAETLDEEIEKGRHVNPVGCNAQGKVVKSTDEVDITGLVAQLDGLLNGQSLETMQLVPQLEMMRNTLGKLEEEGFTNNLVPKTPKSKRYANSESVEKEAEISIHKEALERSRASGVHLNFSGVSFEASDDWGGDDDDGYGADDAAFDDFVAMDENAARYSGGTGFDLNNTQLNASGRILNETNQTTMMLDVICGVDVINSGSQYGYFDANAIGKMTNGNLWAGAAHWKKSERVRKKPNRLLEEGGDDNAGTAPKKKRGSRKKKEKVYLELHESLPTGTFARLVLPRRSKTDPLQISQAAKQRQSKDDNLLPFDAAITIDQFSRLYLRPDASVRSIENGNISQSDKRVGFLDVDQEDGLTFDDGGDDGYGYHYDDADYESSANKEISCFEADEYNVQLDDVRKVNKIEVGYAKIAKKVDVKRLKRDLWCNIESRINPKKSSKIDHTQSEHLSPQEDNQGGLIATEEENPATEMGQTPVLFQDAVARLEGSQAQTDVTVPFYFICILHLANEKGLKLDSSGFGLSNFMISNGSDSSKCQNLAGLPESTDSGSSATVIAEERVKRSREDAKYTEELSDGEDDEETVSDDDG